MDHTNKFYLRMRALFYRTKYRLIRKQVIRFNVASEEETLHTLLSRRASLTRIGEGEFRCMIGESYNSFQTYDPEMQSRLLEALNSNFDNLLVAVSPVLSDEKYMMDKKYWQFILGKEGMKWAELLNPSRKYYNPNITRFYMERKDPAFAEKMINGLKEIWDKRDVLIVEGELTRFGVGNDFVNNAKKVRRIIAPAENAFSKYEQILKSIIDNAKDGPVLMALGPTASILAHDLSRQGIWAIDIGHADIEYEWFKAGAKVKQPIRGKYVNEAGGMSSFIEIMPKDLELYKSQIIAQVK